MCFLKNNYALTFSPKLGLLAQLHYIVILKTVRQSFLKVKQGVLVGDWAFVDDWAFTGDQVNSKGRVIKAVIDFSKGHK